MLGVEALVKPAHHEAEDLARRHDGRQTIRVREEKALELGTGHASREQEVRVVPDAEKALRAAVADALEERGDLAHREPLGNRHLGVHAAGREEIEDRARAERRVEAILAGLQAPIATGEARLQPKGERAANHAEPREPGGNRRERVAFAYHETRARRRDRRRRDEIERDRPGAERREDEHDREPTSDRHRLRRAARAINARARTASCRGTPAG